MGPYIYDVHLGGGREGCMKSVTKTDGKIGGGGGIKKKMDVHFLGTILAYFEL